jgi:hypothetical protein
MKAPPTGYVLKRSAWRANWAGLIFEIDCYSARARVAKYKRRSISIYINPKLLVLTSAVRLALMGEQITAGSGQADCELIERGIPARMYSMEMVSDEH